MTDLFQRNARLRRLVDYLLAFAIIVALSVALIHLKVLRRDLMFADSAMYFQALENIVSRGAMVSQVSAGTDGYFLFEHTPAEEIAHNPFQLYGLPTAVTERNLFRGHVYLILYPIAQLVRIFPVRAVVMSFYVLSYTGTLLLAYYWLRRNNISTIAAGLFCLLIASQPAWGLGLLEGQFYPDRLFVFAGFALMSLTTRDDTARLGWISNTAWLLITAVVCASINERAALVSGIFLLLYSLLYWRERRPGRVYRLALGLGLFGYGYAALKILQNTNSDYGTFFEPDQLFRLLMQPQFSELIGLFLLVNLPLLCLSAFEWRPFFIAAFLMLPNILGNVGGAEKVGWSTHYPSFFFPSLVWAALGGYVVLCTKAKAAGRMMFIYSGTVAVIVLFAMLDPYTIPIRFDTADARRYNFVANFIDYVSVYSNAANLASLETAADGIIQAVPPHSIVSTVEGGTALLYEQRTVRFYPADIDNADFAVLGTGMVNGRRRYSGVVTSLGADEEEQLNELAVSRLKLDGYDLDHPIVFPGFRSLAVVKRIH